MLKGIFKDKDNAKARGDLQVQEEKALLVVTDQQQQPPPLPALAQLQADYHAQAHSQVLSEPAPNNAKSNAKAKAKGKAKGKGEAITQGERDKQVQEATLNFLAELPGSYPILVLLIPQLLYYRETRLAQVATELNSINAELNKLYRKRQGILQPGQAQPQPQPRPANTNKEGVTV